MPVENSNPFPLNIGLKQDSWDKVQLLQYMDPSLTLTAKELNKMIRGLNYLFGNVSVGNYSGNVPLKLQRVLIDFTAGGSTMNKVKNFINTMPNYPLADGYAQWFYTQRMVLTNDIGITDTTPGSRHFAVITEYFLLSKKIGPVGGVASLGTGGTQIDVSDLVSLPPKDTRNVAPQDFDLGNIGTTAVWTAANASGPRSTPNTSTILFRAIQNNKPKVWLYLGEQENVGVGYAATSSTDFRVFPSDTSTTVDPAPPPALRIWKRYDNIDRMLESQSEQTGNELIYVEDAIGDTNIVFPSGENRRQATYQKQDSNTGRVLDYTLISAPWADSTVDLSNYENATELDLRSVADRERDNHTGTQLAITISDFDDSVDDNSSVVANTAKVGITTTQASNIAANTAKVTNANHTGDVTGEAALTIADKAVTKVKMEDMPKGTILGRKNTTNGVPENLTKADTLALLNVSDGANKNVKSDWIATTGDAEVLNKPQQTNFNIYNQNKGNKRVVSTTTKSSIITASTGSKNLPSYNKDDSFIGKMYGTFNPSSAARIVKIFFTIGNREGSVTVNVASSTVAVPFLIDYSIDFPTARLSSITGIVVIGSDNVPIDLDFTIITGLDYDISVLTNGGIMNVNKSYLHRNYNS